MRPSGHTQQAGRPPHTTTPYRRTAAHNGKVTNDVAHARARCTERGCFWRWPSGPDRPCAEHAADTGIWNDRLDLLTSSMAAPGDGDWDDDA